MLSRLDSPSQCFGSAHNRSPDRSERSQKHPENGNGDKRNCIEPQKLRWKKSIDQRDVFEARRKGGDEPRHEKAKAFDIARIARQRGIED